jgi:hypothetical protein
MFNGNDCGMWADENAVQDVRESSANITNIFGGY